MIPRRLIAYTASIIIAQSALAQTFHTYHCRDGSEFVAAFFAGDRTAYLQLDGKAVTLSRYPSLSGSHYRKGDISLRITKTVTNLKRGRQSTECFAP